MKESSGRHFHRCHCLVVFFSVPENDSISLNPPLDLALLLSRFGSLFEVLTAHLLPDFNSEGNRTSPLGIIVACIILIDVSKDFALDSKMQVERFDSSGILSG